MEHYLQIAILLTLLSSALSTGVLELKGEDSCTVVSTEGDNVDVLCTLPTDRCTNQSTAVIKWLFASTGYRREIKDSDGKYGIWDELKSEANTVSSLLRVRETEKDKDVGIYTCTLSCQNGDEGSRAMEICVKDSATNLTSCDLSTTDPICTHVFANGVCNEHCDTEEQLFDGGDCDAYRDELCTTSDCTSSYNNGFCDTNCSSSQCGYDGGDCLRMTQSITREQLAIVIPTAFHTDIYVKHLSRQISSLLATLVELNGQTIRWSATDSKGIQTTYLNPAVFNLAKDELTLLQFKLTPQSCVSDRGCFLRVRSAAKYISLRLIKDIHVINSSIAAVGIDSTVDECSTRHKSESPNANDSGNQNNKQEKATLVTKGLSLAPSEIAGIALCVVSVILLVIGVVIACRYRAIANSRHATEANKQSQVNAYIASIPDNADLSSEASCSTGTPKSPHSSIARSVTSKETIQLREVVSPPPDFQTFNEMMNTSQA